MRCTCELGQCKHEYEHEHKHKRSGSIFCQQTRKFFIQSHSDCYTLTVRWRRKLKRNTAPACVLDFMFISLVWINILVLVNACTDAKAGVVCLYNMMYNDVQYTCTLYLLFIVQGRCLFKDQIGLVELFSGFFVINESFISSDTKSTKTNLSFVWYQ